MNARPWPLLLALAFSFRGFSEDLKPEIKAELQLIEQAINDWDISGAKKALTALERVAPPDVEPIQYYKGRIAFEEGRYDEAVSALSAAGIPDKPGSYLRLAKDTRKVMEHHRRVESEHFIFFYPEGKDEILAPYAIETLEAIREALGTDLGYRPTGKTRVEVVNDARELAKVSTLTYQQIATTGTIAICKFSKLIITSPKAVVRGYDWQDTLAHEFTHLVVTQKSRNTVPIWLHEGIAKYLESRWRGGPGVSLSPSTLALLGERVKKGKLISFEKMHPSIALLPSAEDAATAFAEVFFAVDLVYREKGTAGLRAIVESLAAGADERKAVETATERSFAAFEKAWMGHMKKQPFPKEFIPLSDQKVVLKEQSPVSKKESSRKGKEINFSDFAEVEESGPRKMAHLGELMRERGRALAAAEEYGKAHSQVGDKYESISNKYALALLELRRVDEAEQVLQGALRLHPGSPTTNVHLGRIYLFKKQFERARAAYRSALASDPFDEEIHLSLVRIETSLGAKDLAQRARNAAIVLTGLPSEMVDRVVSSLGKNDRELSDANLPGRSEDREANEPTARQVEGPDGGNL